jgi:16S rRNA (adenine1518-N6/adenine1519-N6)-dimethyltransferase
MLYNNKQQLLELLKRENLYTEKRLGQNFIFNTQIIENILETADLQSDDHIVEVGPGLGILTLELAQRAQKVTTIELDQKLIPYLEKTFTTHNERKNIEIIHQDVLKSTPPSSPYKLIANIPYYITSPILSHFLQVYSPSIRPTIIVLLVQLEVAQKICAKTGDHGVLSLQTQIFAQPKIISKVAPENFLPAPKVDSAILKLTIHPEPLVSNPQLFIDLIKKAFSMKRKTLLNSLEGWHGLDRAGISALLEKAGINFMQRPQNLEIADFERICLALPPN